MTRPWSPPASPAGKKLLAPRPYARRRDSLALLAEEISEIDIPSRPIRSLPAPVADGSDGQHPAQTSRHVTSNPSKESVIPMHRSTRSSAAPVFPTASDLEVRVILDAVVRSSRPLLIQIAREHLEGRRQNAEDLVQDVCLAVLEGTVVLSSDPRAALLDMLRAVAARASSRGSRATYRRKRP